MVDEQDECGKSAVSIYKDLILALGRRACCGQAIKSVHHGLVDWIHF